MMVRRSGERQVNLRMSLILVDVKLVQVFKEYPICILPIDSLLFPAEKQSLFHLFKMLSYCISFSNLNEGSSDSIR